MTVIVSVATGLCSLAVAVWFKRASEPSARSRIVGYPETGLLPFSGRWSVAGGCPDNRGTRARLKDGQECPSDTSEPQGLKPAFLSASSGTTEAVPFPNSLDEKPRGDALWHDGGMGKRSTRIAKRDEFENALKEVEEKIRSRRGKTPPGVAVEEAGQPEKQDGESAEGELDPDGRRK